MCVSIPAVALTRLRCARRGGAGCIEEAGVPEDAMKKMEQEVRKEIDEAVNAAKAESPPVHIAM